MRKSVIDAVLGLAAIYSVVAVASPKAAFAGDQALSIQQRIRQEVTQAAAAGFSGQVLVAQHGVVLFDDAAGWSDAAHKIPITKQTKFYIASITKSFTAVAILRLQDQGKLSLSDHVSKYFPDVRGPAGAITIQQLLDHTSGIGKNYAADGVVDRTTAVDAILSKPLVGSPGKDFLYTDDDYVLLAAIIEIASGTTYESFLRKAELIPAGMAETDFWGAVDIDDRKVFASLLSLPRATRLRANWGDRGASGLLSNVDDLYRWWQALGNGVVLSRSTADALFAPRMTLSSGTEITYGWFRSTTDSGLETLWTRGGEDIGHNAVLVFYPDKGVTIVITSNAGQVDGEEWNRRLKDALERVIFE